MSTDTNDFTKLLEQKYPDLLYHYNKNELETRMKIINKLKSLPSRTDGKGWIYGFKLSTDTNLANDFKIKLGRTERPNPYIRVKEQGGEMLFCISTPLNRRLEKLVHLFFKYANIVRDSKIEWFNFKEKINIEKITSSIKELTEDYVDKESSRDMVIKFKLININTASKQELMELPGIADKLSDRIINYRQKYGNFNDIESIIHVPYIKKRFSAIKDHITV